MRIEDKEILKDVTGTFDGESFVSEDGDKYPVSPNYASKSCLVEGDELRLLITSDGMLVYKQIGLVDRKSFICHLVETERGLFGVHNGNMYKLNQASVAYMKAENGDEAVIVIPKYNQFASYGALKAVIKKKNN